MVQSVEGTRWGPPPLYQEGAAGESQSAVCGQDHVPGIIAMQWPGGPRSAAGTPGAVELSHSAGTAPGVATPLSAVARTWIGVSCGAVHGRHRALQHRVEEPAGLFGVAVGQRLHRVFQTDEQDRHLLAFPFQSTQRQKWCDAGRNTGVG
jgi:hypothetical protein